MAMNMPAHTATQIPLTQLLADWCNGDESVPEKLFPLVYQELKRIARRHMRNESPGHTLQTTALVNEAYLRLVDQKRVSWQNRAHFYAIAAQTMRRILVDHARSHARLKRGGDASRVSLDEAAAISLGESADLLALDGALEELARIDKRRSQVVELRFFGGLSNAEIAEVLKIAPNTVMRDWNLARAWLYHEMSGPGSISNGK
ncbi:MAG: sigma-70 family RNA polymerase sigma factor [Pyrinomonadaceae bacterium]